MIIAMMQFLSVLPNLTKVSQAKVVGRKVFDILERIPLIKDSDKAKQNQSKEKIGLENSISFKDVHFRYPTAPDVQPDTLQGVNFKIKAGTSTAIVGPSGSGKSTIVQMIERFYDPKSGEINFDNQKLKDVKLSILRDSIGYVSQEPVLILGSIRDNLMFANKDATQTDIEEALRKANAGFVKEMGMDSYVGSTAVQNLSGG